MPEIRGGRGLKKHNILFNKDKGWSRAPTLLFSLSTIIPKEKKKKKKRLLKMTNLLELLQSHGIEPRRSSVAHGGEYCSACPECGDGGKGKGSDRFHIWPDKANTNGMCRGRFWCRQCGINGDTIEFVMRFDRMNFPQACAAIGIQIPGGTHTHYSRPTTPSLPSSNQTVARIYPNPSPEWSLRAAAFLADCQARLLDRPDALDWLAKRGMDRAAAIAYGLGYNESSKGGDRYRPRTLWGLQPKQNDKGRDKKLWLPRGWVVPMFSDDGLVLQLRIRRLDADVAAFASDVRYLMVDGSSSATMVLHPEADAHAVVESGLDAILIAAAMGGKVGAVTTWNCSARPDARAAAILNRSQCVLNCFDYDAAGAKELAWWEENFRRYKRWPVPVGKDPGEAYEKGVNIRQWIVDGLPLGLQAGMISSGAVADTDDAALKSWFNVDPVKDGGKIIISTPTGGYSNFQDFVDGLLCNIAHSLGVPGELLTTAIAIPAWPVEPEKITGLKWCILCDGDRFWAADAGGFFCIDCQPVKVSGRMVLTTVPRREYVVD